MAHWSPSSGPHAAETLPSGEDHGLDTERSPRSWQILVDSRRSNLTLEKLRRYAVGRSLFPPSSLEKAIHRLGFVQADPIRAPARAQDLVLRHRVRDYRAGDLERRYPRLDIEEDFFINYGFITRELHRLMHPRAATAEWPKARWAQARAVLELVREAAVAHPREVDAHFAHGKVRNWFGGSSNASTQLLDGMHYRGLVRVARREGGVRLYSAAESHEPISQPDAALDAMVDVIVGLHAPLPERSLSELVRRLRYAAPQWTARITAALGRAKTRLPSALVEGVTWYWLEGEDPASRRSRKGGTIRLLAPFDPIVWDRRRFEIFWGWAYRFEAYTPAPKRVRGYYALPLLWRDEVIGWANLAVRGEELEVDLGFVSGHPPRDPAFDNALDEEIDRMRSFLPPR